jgi:hypothetical protein
MRTKRTIPRACAQCGATFHIPPGRLRHQPGRYCSRACTQRARVAVAPPEVIEQRFWEKVDKHSGHWWNGTECWRWQGHLSKGYGRIHFTPSKKTQAHRYSYMLAGGVIPEGQQIDHLCRNQWCVNPAHLEPVTNRVNMLRGESPPAIVRRTGRCKRGHEMTPENTLTVRTRPNERTCRACRDMLRNARRAAARERGEKRRW